MTRPATAAPPPRRPARVAAPTTRGRADLPDFDDPRNLIPTHLVRASLAFERGLALAHANPMRRMTP